MQLIVASRNSHKTREIQEILGSEFAVRDLRVHPDISEIIETGMSFQENAKIKALTVSRKLPGLVIADDSGLEVDALGGAPGVHSARYAGTRATDQQNVEKLLVELSRACASEEARSARFRCVLALAHEREILGLVEGIVEGRIADRPRGSSGFGYDPIFIPAGFGQTFSELGAAKKNQLSHRARALEKLRTFLIPPASIKN